jgi:FtsZ-binding cell division protein ZapB
MTLVKEEINELDRVNREFIQNNEQLRKDLTNCQEHLSNLLKNNSLLQLEL